MQILTDSLMWFHKGGPVMYLLLICSLMVVSIGVERFLYYKGMQSDIDGLAAALVPALEQGDLAAANALCCQTGGAAAQVAGQGLRVFSKGADRMESVLEGEASLAVAKLRQNLNHLDTIVTIAPLLGLLGTIIGMINSFSVMNLKAGQPLAITGGVGEALIATATGLCVAILSMLVYSYFNHRLDRIITDMERLSILLISRAAGEKA